MPHERILVIDDEESICQILAVILSKESYLVDTVTTAAQAIEMISEKDFDLVLCDIRMPDMDGIELLKMLKEEHSSLMVIMMTAFGTLENAVEAMREGAYDYLSKPIKAKEIILHVQKALERKKLDAENKYLRKQVEEKFSFGNIIGKSPQIVKIFESITKIAPYTSSVLITGESGTGKELIAKAIHFNSSRKTKPFVAVNCGAIPADLLESELFGHKKGAFTGATSSKRGLFEEANGGTLFLDEVADIPENSQVKLLRALQEEEIRPVGSNQTIKIDVRIISATEQNLKEKIRENTFRESLFYRLNVVHLKIPPLRERIQDVPLLTHHFLEKWGRKNRVSPLKIEPQALEILMAYSWPGNVRELENIIERTALMADGKIITADIMPQSIRMEHNDIQIAIPEDVFDLKKVNREISSRVEKELIKRALEKTNANRTKAAILLKISHRTLMYKLKEYNIDEEFL